MKGTNSESKTNQASTSEEGVDTLIECPYCKAEEAEKQGKDSEGILIKCPHCGMTVPNAVTCLYCGSQLHPLNYNPNKGRLPP